MDSRRRHKIRDTALFWVAVFLILAALTAVFGLFVASLFAFYGGSTLAGIGYIAASLAILTTLLIFWSEA